jgi:hypothetical protein
MQLSAHARTKLTIAIQLFIQGPGHVWLDIISRVIFTSFVGESSMTNDEILHSLSDFQDNEPNSDQNEYKNVTISHTFHENDVFFSTHTVVSRISKNL